MCRKRRLGEEHIRPRVEPFIGGFNLTNPWNAMLAGVTFVFATNCPYSFSTPNLASHDGAFSPSSVMATYG